MLIEMGSILIFGPEQPTLCPFVFEKISDPYPLSRIPRLLIFYFFWEKPEKVSRCYVRKILT